RTSTGSKVDIPHRRASALGLPHTKAEDPARSGRNIVLAMPSPTPQPLRRRPRPVAAPPAWPARAVNAVLGFVAFVLVVDALFGSRGLLETIRARRQYADLSADLARKRRDNERLRDDIRRLREDPAAIESVAREQLGLMRDGELVFIIRDQKPGTEDQRSGSTSLPR